MKFKYLIYSFKTFTYFFLVILGGCAANQMPGYQPTYQGYNVPDTLLQEIREELARNHLPIQVKRDLVGRIQLAGTYENEDEVDKSFFVVTSIVGLKSTSPFYPEHIRDKRWEKAANEILAQYAAAQTIIPRRSEKRALIIGISHFKDSRITDIPGEDDAKVVIELAKKAQYKVTSLLGPEATKINIKNSIDKIKSELSPTDSLLIYVSSHGTAPTPGPHEDDRKMSIIVYDTAASSLLDAYKTSLPDTTLISLANMPTKQTYAIIDTCYSGETLKGIVTKSPASAAYISKTNDGKAERASISLATWQPPYTSKGINFVNESDMKIGNSETIKKISKKLAYWNGKFAIITATSEGEHSLAPKLYIDRETGEKRIGSNFTQSFIDYLRMYKGEVFPAFEASKRYTSDWAITNAHEPQNPRMASPAGTDKVPSIFN